MTLYERVKQAGNADYDAPRTDADLLDELRRQLQELVSVDKLAKLARTNPERARNEVRSACRRVFEDPDWVYSNRDLERRLVEQLLDMIFGFGVLEDLIADESITEIIVNGPSRVFIEREGKLLLTDRAFADVGELRALIDRILGPLGRRIDESSPMVNARLPQGHRVNVVVPPIALDGPYVTIRKFSKHVITLEEMCDSGSIDEGLRTFLTWAVRARRNIAVSGGTGSGKTTLLNSLSCVIAHDERIVTIEDSAELRFHTHPDVARLEARPRNAEGEGEVTIRDLVINALRMRPDRIIVGECRGAEAIDMLQAMNTGHDGSLTTLHSNSPAESITRLTTMVRYASELPIDVIEANIASAIHLVVQTQRALDGSRRVSEVVTFAFDRHKGRCLTQPIYKRELGASEGIWTSSPGWLEDLTMLGIATEKEVQSWKHACSLEC
ncbi:MAG: CpaF family protein [Eggerthellaceae bacterium]|nr:CpaF family protein [Eggerthellaceae bacterium]